MVLAADAGNTNIKLGIYESDKLVSTARLATGMTKTAGQYAREVLDFLLMNDIDAGAVEGAAVSTVVPEATKEFLKGVRQLVTAGPLVISKDIVTGIEIKTDVPAELGADRLVNAAAAFHEYGGPLLVIDFGTATTYDVITEIGAFLGGVIAPGVRICAEALWEKTEKLPEIAMNKPERVMGTNTVSSMQSGIYYGYLGQVEYFIRRLKGELATDFKVVATGGLSNIFKGNTNAIDTFDPDLTLKGLYRLYKMNRP
jgi:type III pantothenate kinase